MWTWLRRVFWISLVCGGGYATYTAWQRKNEPDPGAPPEWPPLSETARTPDVAGDATTGVTPDVAGGVAGDDTVDGAVAAWIAPVGGACPDDRPIKANDNSGIYHVPGGRFYERTNPDRCYPDEASAEADGYRRAKA